MPKTIGYIRGLRSQPLRCLDPVLLLKENGLALKSREHDALAHLLLREGSWQGQRNNRIGSRKLTLLEPSSTKPAKWMLDFAGQTEA